MHKVRNEALLGGWSLLPIRLVLGCGFMVHGWAKLSRGPAEFAKLLDWVGAPLPEVTAWVSTVLELLGGLALFVGTFVELVSIPLIVVMLIAMFTVHLRNGFSAINTVGLTEAGPQFGPPGYEVNLLYIAGLLALTMSGAGPLSIDAWQRRTSGAYDRAA
jgi:putative oxidoreductase